MKTRSRADLVAGCLLMSEHDPYPGLSYDSVDFLCEW